MIRTGVMRAFGAPMRRALATHARNRAAAFSAGVVVTAFTQSSTATLLIVSSFVGRGMLALGPAIAIALGADVGATIIPQLLSIGLEWLSPLAVLAGFILFSSVENGRW